MPLEIIAASGPLLDDWRAIHNEIIPTAPLSATDVSERARRNRLTLAYASGELVGNGTMRPPTGPDAVATVIVRILSAHRRRGYGAEYLEAELSQARFAGAKRIETVVLSSNIEGLAFALAHGFVEHDRYLLGEDTVPFIDLHLRG